MNEQTFVTGHVRSVTSCDTNSHRNVKKTQLILSSDLDLTYFSFLKPPFLEKAHSLINGWF